MSGVMSSFGRLLDKCHYLEGPRWHDGRIWVSDFHGHQVLSSGLDGDRRVEAELDDRPSGLGWLPDGRLLVVSMARRAVLRREESGELVEHADLSSFNDSESNDMVVDASGRAYVSGTGFDANAGEAIRTCPLLKVEADGCATVVAEDLYMPNGLTFLPSGELVVAETVGNRLTAFDVLADGALEGSRVWAEFGPRPTSTDLLEVLPTLTVGPDGICADAEGAVWVADSLHNRVLRVAEGGAILQEVSTGAMGAYSCTLGGPTGCTLFICSAPDFNYASRAAAREGQLLTLEVDIPAVS